MTAQQKAALGVGLDEAQRLITSAHGCIKADHAGEADEALREAAGMLEMVRCALDDTRCREAICAVMAPKRRAA